MCTSKFSLKVLFIIISLILIVASIAVPESAKKMSVTLMQVTEGDSTRTITLQIPGSSSKKTTSLAASSQTTFLVTSLADLPDDSLSDNIYFPYTLRAAIENANLTPAEDIITFTPAITQLDLLNALPPIVYPIQISNVTLDGSNIVPQVGFAYYGLTFLNGSSGSTVNNMEIQNFPNAGIFIGANKMIIQRCNIHDNAGPGILGNAVKSCIIGSDGVGNGGNTIYNNTTSSGNGIQLTTDLLDNHCDSNLIRDNYIGTEDGFVEAPNSREGIQIWGNHNRITNNLISGNNYDGIRLGEDVDFPSTGNKIDSNVIGFTIPIVGFTPLPNGIGNSGKGIVIRYSESDTILGNFIGSNYGHGIEFSSSGSNAYIAENIIGIDTSTNVPLGNNGNGMLLRGNSNLLEYNYVGGNITGVSIQGDDNIIRTNLLGSEDLPNHYNSVSGVQVNGNNNVIGGSNIDDGNYCSGNDLYGIIVAGAGSTNNLVQNNYVGVIGPFQILQPNLRSGILVVDSVQGTRIFDNLIIGNDSNGVHILESFGRRPRGTILERNTIGDYLNLGMGNGRSGILIDGAVGTTIGGLLVGDENVIRGNFLHGIEIRNADSTTIIGDTIAGNGGHGIVLDSGLYNQFIENSIYDNELLGIDLGNDGVTSNDIDDLDNGPNMLQNYPLISAITSVNDTLLVVGELDGSPLTNYVIDMYRNTDCDSSGNGEGQFWMDSALVTSGVNGVALLDYKVPSTYDPTSSNLTFTATDQDGNTSEFTPCFELLLVTADVELTMVAQSDTVMIGDTVTIVITVENHGPDIASGITVIDSIPSELTYVSDSATQGNCAFTNNVLTCLTGSLAPSANATISLKVVADSSGLISNSAIATAVESDPFPQNNLGVAMVEVENPTTDISSEGPNGLPIEYSLTQNYPNPFNPSTIISFSLPQRSNVELQIFNLVGQQLREIINTNFPAGIHSIVWDGRSDNGEFVASGVYFYRIVAGDFVDTKKMLLIK